MTYRRTLKRDGKYILKDGTGLNGADELIIYIGTLEDEIEKLKSVINKNKRKLDIEINVDSTGSDKALDKTNELLRLSKILQDLTII